MYSVCTNICSRKNPVTWFIWNVMWCMCKHSIKILVKFVCSTKVMISFRVILFFTILFVAFPSYTLGSYQQVFGPIIEQCNKTFFISRDTLYMEDVDKLFDVMKVDRNGKCFVHCFLQKLDLVDPKGIIRKIGLFDSLKNTLQKLPDNVRSYNLSLLLQKVAMSLIGKCENSEPVKQEVDPCDKLFKFFVCFRSLK